MHRYERQERASSRDVSPGTLEQDVVKEPSTVRPSSQQGKPGCDTVAEPPYDVFVYGPDCPLNAEQRRLLAHEVTVRGFGGGLFVGCCLAFAILTAMHDRVEEIPMAAKFAVMLFVALLGVTGVGIAWLRPWAGKALVAWVTAVMGGILVTQLVEGTGNVWSMLLCVAVPLAAGWQFLGGLGHTLLAPGYQRLSDIHPYRYKTGRYKGHCFTPMSRRLVWIWLALLVVPSVVIGAYFAVVRSSVQLSLPPIESDWLRRDDEKAAGPGGR